MSAASASSARRITTFTVGSCSGGHIPPSVATATWTAEPAWSRRIIDTAHPSVSSSGCGASTRHDAWPTLAETSVLMAQRARPTSAARGALAGSIASSKDRREIHDIGTRLAGTQRRLSGADPEDASYPPEETAWATAPATVSVEAAGNGDAGSRTSAGTVRPDPSTESTAASIRSAASTAPT